jgi:PTS system galactitol-specific IIC component
VEYLANLFSGILQLKSYILLPGVIFIIAVVFSVKPFAAFKSALNIGVGLIGFSILFSFFIENVSPLVTTLIAKTGKETNIIDVGWPVLSSLTWSAGIASVTIPIAIAVNILLLVIGLTDTFNVDIWNYWHVAIVGVVVFELTDVVWMSIASIVIMTWVNLKLADYSVKTISKHFKIDGISDTTMTSSIFLPFAAVGNYLIDKIPVVKKINITPLKPGVKYKIIGEPGIIAFVIGFLIALFAGNTLSGVLDFAIKFSAVFLILPKIVHFTQEGFIPLTEAVRDIINKKLKLNREINIGVNHMVFMDNPSLIITSIILIPVIVFISIMFKWIDFFPMGDLTNIIGAIVMIVGVARGNLFRAIVISIPMLIMNIKIAAYMAPVYTNLAHRLNYPVGEFDGLITSSMNGGNPISLWLIKIFQGNFCAIILIVPVLLIAWFIYRKRSGSSNRIFFR